MGDGTTANDGAVTRRTALQWAGTAGMLAVGSVVVGACAAPASAPLPAGLGTDPNGLYLQPGFSSRIIGRGGEQVFGIDYRIFPDGAATFPDAAVPGGWYYVVNHEIPGGGGGVTSVRFAPDGQITGCFQPLTGTSTNCAGGATPWGTWLSGEEYDGGWIWEVDPTASARPVARTALGTFSHEAAAVAQDGRVYLTEDKSNGCLYRFTPDRPADLSVGLLEVACGTSAPGTVVWRRVPDPSATVGPTRTQVPDALQFDGGEGIDCIGNLIWFTTKGDVRVWEYDLTTQDVSIRFQGGAGQTLDAVDNLLADSSSGALLVAEDGGNLELVVIRPDGSSEAVVRVEGQEGSEITGPCFSPDGQRLYFSSQRGPATAAGLPFGVTYEVSGPWDAYLGRS